MTGKPNQTEFVLRVWAVGDRRERQALALADRLGVTRARTNRDVHPSTGMAHDRGACTDGCRSERTRELQAALETSYCGSTLYKSNLGRERAARVADDRRIRRIAPAGDERCVLGSDRGDRARRRG